MRLATLVPAGFVALASAQSICDKYSASIFPSNPDAQVAFIHVLVATALLGTDPGGGAGTSIPQLVTGNSALVSVPGILISTGADYNGTSVNLYPLFAGAGNTTNINGLPGKTNFIDGGAPNLTSNQIITGGLPGSNQAAMFDGMCSYFASVLGCSSYGTPDGVPAYAGSDSQYELHMYMNVTDAEFGYFVQQYTQSLAALGGAQSDVDDFSELLTAFFGQRCSTAQGIIPGQNSALQAICTDSSCPLASSSNCTAYADDVPKSSTSSASSSTSTASSSSSPSTATSTPLASSTSTQGSSTAMSTTSTSTPSSTTAAKSGLSEGASIAVGVAVGLAVLAIAILLGCWCIARRRRSNGRTDKHISLASLAEFHSGRGIDFEKESRPSELDSRPVPAELHSPVNGVRHELHSPSSPTPSHHSQRQWPLGANELPAGRTSNVYEMM